MILGIIFAHVWGVLELVVLGSFTRTIRVRTALIAVGTGFYTCSVVALLLYVLWTRSAANLLHLHLYTIVRTGSYTLDPLIEECVKAAPIAALLWLVPSVRQQWSAVDCVLIAAAAGSGFGLAEDLYRYSGAVSRSTPGTDGWDLSTDLSFPFVPSLTNSMTSWLPSGVRPTLAQSWWTSAAAHNLHLEWSAIGGLAVALIFLQKRRSVRWAGIGLFAYIVADHAASNWRLLGEAGLLSFLVVPFNLLRNVLWLMPVAALVIASFLDRSRQQKAYTAELALVSEHHIKPRILGTLRAAISQLPWSTLWVDTFSRLRRAYSTVEDVQYAQTLRRSILILRNRIDAMAVGHDHHPRNPSIRICRGAFVKLFRKPQTIVWCALILPPVTWFLVGGYPETVRLQSLLMTHSGWTIVRASSLAALIWTAFQIAQGYARWHRVASDAFGEISAQALLRLLSGAGACFLGVYASILAISDGQPGDHLINNFHVLEAAGSATLITSLLIAAGAVILFPPAAAAISEFALSTVGELAALSIGDAVAVTEGEMLASVPADSPGVAGSILEPEASAGADLELTKPQRDFEWTEAQTLDEQLAMEQARAGAGTPTEMEAFDDPKYSDPGWKKIQYVADTADGNRINIHYMRNDLTGETDQFKFISDKGAYPTPDSPKSRPPQ
jgi:hypothetical protein